ncbi:MAG TPA: lysophospholipid acyltransferase family protein [Gemmatimonadales bacterium]|nr:lysophospholipid acyltransferase family protein [Gemmatimonadales bacterium]
MLRTVWFFLVLLVSTVWHGGRALVAGLLGVPQVTGGVYDDAGRRWAQSALWASGVPYRLHGLEHVPRNSPVVFASNHQSWFDIFLVLAATPGSVRFVAKKELARVPLLGGAMRAAGHIYIDRQNLQAAFEAYQEAAGTIRTGISAVVFPEGTRSRTGELLPFKKGPFVLAIAAGVPIVPAYCAGTFTLMPKGSRRISPHPIALIFGTPISTQGMTYEDREPLMEQTRRAVERLRVDAAKVLG